MRRTPFSQDLDRGDGFEKDTSRKYFFHAPPTCGGVQGGEGRGLRTVMRNPMRDPMRDIDLMVLGDVGASTPLPSSTREHRIQFASRTREPASRLLPLMARTPNFEATFVFDHFLYPVRDPMRGTTDFPGFRP